MSSNRRAAFKEARALLGGMVMSIPARIAQLRSVADDSEAAPPPVAEAAPRGARRRLVRQTILNAAQSLRAPIVRD